MNIDSKITENIVAGLYSSFTNLGEAIGPTVSSILVHHFGFQTSQEVYAIFLMTFTILYFSFTGFFTVCMKDPE